MIEDPFAFFGFYLVIFIFIVLIIVTIISIIGWLTLTAIHKIISKLKKTNKKP
jgi:1,4-dihydroxy-2-naphthoate octaprenyltransferase